MRLPSGVGGKTTEEVGYYRYPHVALAEWLADSWPTNWTLAEPGWTGFSAALDDLRPTEYPLIHAFVPVGDGWTLFLNNTVHGTDVGLEPAWIARELECITIRAVCAEEPLSYAARILEVYGPEGHPEDKVVRIVTAADDGGRWVFHTAGTPYAFEDVGMYREPRKSRRFTCEMLYAYLGELGVPYDVEPSWADAVVLEQDDPPPPFEHPDLSFYGFPRVSVSEHLDR